MTIAEYAKERSISYEAARKVIARYREDKELQGHVKWTRKGYEIDEYAATYIDQRRRKNKETLKVLTRAEREAIQQENEALKQENQYLKQKLKEAGIKPKRKWYEVLFGTKED